MSTDSCVHCAAYTDVPEPHTRSCPFTTNVWPVLGGEHCPDCGQPIDDVYTLVPLSDTVDLVVCLGCAALHAIGASS